MPNPEVDVSVVKKIILEEIGPALEEKAREIMVAVNAQVFAFQEQIRTEVMHHHAENRIRMQEIDRQASKAVDQNELILSRIESQESSIARSEGRMDSLNSSVKELIGEVRSWAGRRQGETEASARYESRASEVKDRNMNVFRWFITLLTSSGILAWLSKHFHLHWGGK